MLAFFFFFFFLLFLFFFSCFHQGNLPYTSSAGFIIIREVSLTRPVLASFLSGEFLLHIPCWHFILFILFFLGSFFYSSHAGFLFLSGEFLLHIPCCLDFYAGFYYYAGNFSYTSRAVLIFLQGVLLTHPMLDFYLFIF